MAGSEAGDEAEAWPAVGPPLSPIKIKGSTVVHNVEIIE